MRTDGLHFEHIGKNPGAELAKQRWKKTTKKQRQEVGVTLRSARAAKLTPEQRSEIAKKAAEARWGKKTEKPSV